MNTAGSSVPRRNEDLSRSSMPLSAGNISFRRDESDFPRQSRRLTLCSPCIRVLGNPARSFRFLTLSPLQQITMGSLIP